MLTIAICDDNKSDIQTTEALLMRCLHRDYELFAFCDETALLEHLEKTQIDILIMDIVLNNINGIDVVQTVNEVSPKTQIIYQTANPEFFEEVYKTEHTYFLAKPLKYEKFSNAIQKASKKIEQAYIVLQNGTKEKMLLSDICYIEIKGHIISLVTTTICKHSRMTIEQAEQILPKDTFLRCHRSYIVNMQQVIYYEPRTAFRTAAAGEVPIGRKYAEIVDAVITKFWGSM